MRHKRAASPYQSACQPENEQTHQGQCNNKGRGHAGRARWVNAYITTWKRCVLKEWAAIVQAIFFKGDAKPTIKTLFKGILGIRKIVCALPPADTLPSFWMTGWGVSQVWSSIFLSPYQISSFPPEKNNPHKTWKTTVMKTVLGLPDTYVNELPLGGGLTTF